ncbi:MAG: MarR family transcriptional regulator, partial [Clostridia bacterium]|nr:MarR family transcriptional regulator [Clostridia bacterium]
SICGSIFRSEKLKKYGLGDNNQSYILILCRNPGISQDALARRLFINKSNVTRTLAQLEQNGFVTRRVSDKDRRVTLVFPTEKAYEVLPTVREVLREWREYLTEGFTDEEKRLLLELTRRLAGRAAEYADLSEDALREDFAENGENGENPGNGGDGGKSGDSP